MDFTLLSQVFTAEDRSSLIDDAFNLARFVCHVDFELFV